MNYHNRQMLHVFSVGNCGEHFAGKRAAISLGDHDHQSRCILNNFLANHNSVIDMQQNCKTFSMYQMPMNTEAKMNKEREREKESRKFQNTLLLLMTQYLLDVLQKFFLFH